MMDWQNACDRDIQAEVDRPVVEIEAEGATFRRGLNEYESLEDACEEFASTYDHGGDTGPVTCVGRLHAPGGDEADSVRFTFGTTTPAIFDHERSWS